MPQEAPASPIGRDTPRVDGPLKVTGTAQYASDFHFPGLLYAVPVEATIANGKITKLDTAAAEKMPGVRAGMCHDTYSAHQGVEHDDINVLVLGSRVIGVMLAQDLVKAFLGAKFTNEERHVRRLGKVKAIEAKYAAAAKV